MAHAKAGEQASKLASARLRIWCRYKLRAWWVEELKRQTADTGGEGRKVGNLMEKGLERVGQCVVD